MILRALRSPLFPYTPLFRSLLAVPVRTAVDVHPHVGPVADVRSEEHTSALQSHSDLVCRLLREKKIRVQASMTYPQLHATQLGVDHESSRHVARNQSPRIGF